jgi:hypothetical protein
MEDLRMRSNEVHDRASASHISGAVIRHRKRKPTIDENENQEKSYIKMTTSRTQTAFPSDYIIISSMSCPNFLAIHIASPIHPFGEKKAPPSSSNNLPTHPTTPLTPASPSPRKSHPLKTLPASNSSHPHSPPVPIPHPYPSPPSSS